jgi:RNA polymerase sigma factor (TIGR02999 family)
MTDVTRLIDRIQQGDHNASELLLPLVYNELRKLAAAKMATERNDHTLAPTALVHEAYLRLVGDDPGDLWDGRGHFFAAAAEAMRRILINHARDRNRVKRGGTFKRINLDDIDVAIETPDEELLALDQALDEFSQEQPEIAELVKLRFFTGLTVQEAARTQGISPRTADRNWSYARAWFLDRLKTDG